MSEVQDELERLKLKSEIIKIVYGAVIHGVRESSEEAIEPVEAIDRLEALFNRHAEKRAVELIEKMYDPNPAYTQGNISNFLQGQAQLKEPQE